VDSKFGPVVVLILMRNIVNGKSLLWKKGIEKHMKSIKENAIVNYLIISIILADVNCILNSKNA